MRENAQTKYQHKQGSSSVILEHSDAHLVGRLKLSLNMFGSAFNGIQLLLQLLEPLNDITPQWAELRLTANTYNRLKTARRYKL